MAAARNNRRRSRRGRGRFGPLFKLLCAAALVLALTVGATVFFRVETVVVSGNSRYTQEEVVAASGIETGDNLFHMNKYQVAQHIRETLPYVGEVSIQRSLPSTITIQVKEWQAAARVEPPADGGAAYLEELQAQAAEGNAGDGSAAASSGGAEERPEVAGEAWLISVSGKLLEPAPADSTALSVTGLTALMPRAGSMLAVPTQQAAQKEGLLGLLAELEAQGLLAGVSQIDLGTTRINMRYLDRFDVELLLNGDFSYLLQVMQAAVEDLNTRIGPDCTGTLDLTQEQYPAVYSPS